MPALGAWFWRTDRVVLHTALSPTECRDRLAPTVEPENVQRYGRLPHRGQPYLFKGTVQTTHAEVREWNLGRGQGYVVATLVFEGRRDAPTEVTVDLQPLPSTVVFLMLFAIGMLIAAVVAALGSTGMWFVLPLGVGALVGASLPALQRMEARTLLRKLQHVLDAGTP